MGHQSRTPPALDGTGQTLKGINRATGLDVGYLSRVFNGKIDPSLKMLKRIAAHLGWTTDQLISRLDGAKAHDAQDLEETTNNHGEEGQNKDEYRAILPTALVEKATRASGVGLTPTIRQGLEAVIASDAYRQLRKLRGKVRLSIDVKELRRD